jgi:hypothetical protein
MVELAVRNPEVAPLNYNEVEAGKPPLSGPVATPPEAEARGLATVVSRGAQRLSFFYDLRLPAAAPSSQGHIHILYLYLLTQV